MNKKNVVLLGGSTCSMINGLQKGLKEGIEKFNQYNYTKLKFYNFSLGASDSSQRIFSIYKNNNIINKAFMVIVSINTNEYDMFGVYNFSIKTLKRNLEILCKILANLNSKIIFIIQPLSIQSNKYKLDIINKLIKNKIYHYNFNYIDMQQYYDEKNVNEFFKTNDPYHQLATIMQILGKNIIENINHFYNNQLKQKYVIPNFIVKSPTELFQIDISLKSKRLKNSLFDETIYKLDNQIKLQFKPEFKNYCIIGIATCNFFELEDYNCFASFTLENKTTKIVKGVKSYYYLFHTLEKEFIIDENSFIFFNENNEALTESSVWIHKDKYVNSIHHCGLSYFLLANFKKLDKKIISTDKKINVSKKYNFTHLIPTVEDYKSIIEEYNQRMDPIKLEPLQNQINTLKTQIFDLTNENIQIKNLIDKKYNLEIFNLEQDLIIKKLESKKLAKSLGIKMDIINPKVTFIQANSAKARIQNQLSYKLGQAMIENSKSILGYIRMPYVLSYIKDKHKQEQKIYQEKIKKDPSLKLPPLESYADYNEALKFKEHLSYKLGEALIKANNNWYGGGYIKLWFEIRRIKKEFKNKKA